MLKACKVTFGLKGTIATLSRHRHTKHRQTRFRMIIYHTLWANINSVLSPISNKLTSLTPPSLNFTSGLAANEGMKMTEIIFFKICRTPFLSKDDIHLFYSGPRLPKYI